jgi:hypothetical protein
MRKRTLLQSLLSYLVAEHVCVPPDARGFWVPVSEQAARSLGPAAYVCPECGQHMARSERLEKAA